jgi:hypothetical protein
VCQDIESHLYADGSASVKFGLWPNEKSISQTFKVWDASNSPVRMHSHFEDGKEVGYCSRGKSYTYGYWRTGWMGSKYGTLYSGDGASSTGWGYNDEGEWVEYATYEYELNDDHEATITKYYGNTRALIIPDTIDGYKVVGIGYRAFEENGYLQTVAIPDAVTEVGDYAFSGCKALSQVTLPRALVKLGAEAFGDCVALSSITIPASLEDCGLWDGPFGGCTALRDVRFDEGTKRVASGLLAGCPGVESVAVPEGVTSVDSFAFDGCTSLKTVGLPSTLTKIDYRAFDGCTALSEVVIPDAVTEVGPSAFSGSGLVSISVPEGVGKLGDSAFANCTSLEKATIAGGISRSEEHTSNSSHRL